MSTTPTRRFNIPGPVRRHPAQTNVAAYGSTTRLLARFVHPITGKTVYGCWLREDPDQGDYMLCFDPTHLFEHWLQFAGHFRYEYVPGFAPMTVAEYYEHHPLAYGSTDELEYDDEPW